MFRKIVLIPVFIFCFCACIFGQEQGSGTGNGNGSSGKCRESDRFTDKNNQAFAVLSKPQAKYTDDVRMNNVRGTIRLSVTFLGSGKIGEIEVVKGLPHGLTRQAINAAKKICFRPKIVDGKPQDVVMEMRYSFTIY
jgi:TonB family protein